VLNKLFLLGITTEALQVENRRFRSSLTRNFR